MKQTVTKEVLAEFLEQNREQALSMLSNQSARPEGITLPIAGAIQRAVGKPIDQWSDQEKEAVEAFFMASEDKIPEASNTPAPPPATNVEPEEEAKEEAEEGFIAKSQLLSYLNSTKGALLRATQPLIKKLEEMDSTGEEFGKLSQLEEAVKSFLEEQEFDISKKGLQSIIKDEDYSESLKMMANHLLAKMREKPLPKYPFEEEHLNALLQLVYEHHGA